MQNEKCEMKKEKIPEIRILVERLHKITDLLGGDFEKLIQRLDIVTRDSESKNNAELMPDEVVHTPLGSEINGVINRLETIDIWVRDLMDRIEL